MVLDIVSIQSSIIGQFILPFALFFAIVYGSLKTAKVFEGNSVNAIVAGVIGFIAALFAPVTSALFEFMPAIIAILVILFLYNLIYTLISGKKPNEKTTAGAQAGTDGPKPNGDVILVVGAVLIFLAVSGRSFIPDLAGIDQTNLIFIFALLGVLLILKKGYGKTVEKPST